MLFSPSTWESETCFERMSRFSFYCFFLLSFPSFPLSLPHVSAFPDRTLLITLDTLSPPHGLQRVRHGILPIDPAVIYSPSCTPNSCYCSFAMHSHGRFYTWSLSSIMT